MLPPDLPDELAARIRTVLRFVAGLVLLLLIGLVLWQFHATRHIASGIFASGAVFAVVIGLAAQGTLGNPIAGFVLALAQPIREGDRVTISGTSGRVVRIGLSYTRIDAGDGTHMEVPNTLLAQQAVVVERVRPPSP